MITSLYRLVFKNLLKRGLEQKFRYFNAGKSLSSEEAQEVIALNQPYYEKKLGEELDLAFVVLKEKAPWLNPLSWLFFTAVCVCAVGLTFSTSGNWLMATSLGAGALALGIVAWILFKSTKFVYATLEDSLQNTPASFMIFQIPLCLIQVQLAFGMLIMGAFTHNIFSVITSMSLLVIAVVTQFTAMSNYILRLELRNLDAEGIREFMKSTAPLYSHATKAWLLSETMEGANISVGMLQAMQGKERRGDADATI